MIWLPLALRITSGDPYDRDDGDDQRRHDPKSVCQPLDRQQLRDMWETLVLSRNCENQFLENMQVSNKNI